MKQIKQNAVQTTYAESPLELFKMVFIYMCLPQINFFLYI